MSAERESTWSLSSKIYVKRTYKYIKMSFVKRCINIQFKSIISKHYCFILSGCDQGNTVSVSCDEATFLHVLSWSVAPRTYTCSQLTESVATTRNMHVPNFPEVSVL